MRVPRAVDLFVDIQRDSDVSLRAQLEQQLRRAIEDGRLRQGTALPSTRTLAAHLELSRGVVVEVFEQLVALGYLKSRHGAGTVVAPLGPSSLRAERRAVHQRSPAMIDLRPFRLYRSAFCGRLWSKAVEHATRSAQMSSDSPSAWVSRQRALSQPASFPRPPWGEPDARASVATHLTRVRRVEADVANTILCASSPQTFSLVFRALRLQGARSIAIEAPSYERAHEAALANGLRVHAIACDADGMLVNRLYECCPDAVLVTPQCQYPSGAVLSTDRRQSLLHWAQAHDGLILEDEVNAEFRVQSQATATLQEACPDRVIYIGASTMALSPAFRLGWLVFPARLSDAFENAVLPVDPEPAWLSQMAFAYLLGSGDLERHLRAVRSELRLRRAALLTALTSQAEGRWSVQPSPSTNFMLNLARGIDVERVVTQMQAKGVQLQSVSTTAGVAPGIKPAALLVGAGCVDPSAVDRAVGLLREAIDEVAHLRLEKARTITSSHSATQSQNNSSCGSV
jgi:GntR family transcriptional regulator / MocR family aminotransferase